MLGSFGTVIFKTSASLIRTFDGFQRSGQAKYATHERAGHKALIQFTAPALETVSFTMSFSVELGVNPSDEIGALRTMRDEGVAALLILDGKPLARFVITGLTETWKRVDNSGALLAADVSVSMQEYVEAVT